MKEFIVEVIVPNQEGQSIREVAVMAANAQEAFSIIEQKYLDTICQVHRVQ